MSIEVGMTLQVLGALATMIGGCWALVKVIVSQFNRQLDERFTALEKARAEGQSAWNKRMEAIEQKQQDLDKDVRQILIEMPREYVTRTDYVRRETVIEAKIDQLTLRIQNWILEEKHGN